MAVLWVAFVSISVSLPPYSLACFQVISGNFSWDLPPISLYLELRLCPDDPLAALGS